MLSACDEVMGMIEQIIQDAKAMEAEAIRSEEDAQKAAPTRSMGFAADAGVPTRTKG